MTEKLERYLVVFDFDWLVTVSCRVKLIPMFIHCVQVYGGSGL